MELLWEGGGAGQKEGQDEDGKGREMGRRVRWGRRIGMGDVKPHVLCTCDIWCVV